MKLLHTSDWHLGRSFHGVDLLAAQAEHLDHLVATARAEQVDVVLLAGDVFDRALPPVDAVELFSSTLARFAGLGVRVVVTSGNHDSAVRLGVHAELADAAGIHLRTRWQDVGTPVVVEDRHGPVALHGLPYLEPDAVRQAWRLPERSHEAALRAAMVRVRADLDRRGGRSVVLAHAFVAGSPDQEERLRSDSERDISVGGVQLVPTSVFAGVSYTALGHLHSPAALSDSVRYSGSPVAYSFSEAGRPKGSWLVELGATGVERADLVPAPVHRPVALLRGRIDDLVRDPAHASVEAAWLSVTLTDSQRPAHAMERLRSRFPHVLTLAFDPEGAAARPRLVVPHVSGRSDLDVALGFVAEVRELEPSSEEALLLQLACESCRATEDPDLDLVGGRAPRPDGRRRERGA